MTPFWNRMAALGYCEAVPALAVPRAALFDEAAREQARATLDSLVSHDVVGLTRMEISDVVAKFPGAKKRDIKAHREFRIKRMILEEFDRRVRSRTPGTFTRAAT